MINGDMIWAGGKMPVIIFERSQWFIVRLLLYYIITEGVGVLILRAKLKASRILQ